MKYVRHNNNNNNNNNNDNNDNNIVMIKFYFIKTKINKYKYIQYNNI